MNPNDEIDTVTGNRDKGCRDKILLVDDDPINIELVTDILRNDYDIISACNGNEALEKIKSGNPDIVLLDIIMPGMSGYEVCEKIKQQDTTRFTPVVMVTSFSELEYKIKAIEVGADDFLTKPINKVEVITRVKSLLKTKYFHDRLVESKKKIEEQNQILRKARDELEIRVQERTSDLTNANEVLQAEITERRRAEDQIRQSLKEKEVLLREIHHRVKNNMQIISSLLRLQSEYIREEKYLDMFKDCQNRIISMSLVHEKLYHSRDLAKIDFKYYITDMVNGLFRSYGFGKDRIKLELNVEDVPLNIDSAIPCGLIINELITNSLKHAFPGGRSGEIKIVLRKTDGNTLELLASDNGVGIPEDIDIKKTESLGLHLVTLLVNRQLEGEINLDRSKGTEFQIKFRNK
ncbi:MAG: response regulator [Candidatus Methanoperedens sp.]|nr:response regulator [Candidatus Methanoperedens sp.]